MIDPPDSHHLRAALGWLELGNHDEAGREISRINPDQLNHPDVLEIRWRICAEGGSWEAGLEVARKLILKAPDRSSGWIHRAYCLRRIPKGGGLKKAWEALHPAYEKFPKEPIIPYNLACYAALFGNLDESVDWLHKAMESAEDTALIKKMALEDPDLEVLHERIRDW